MAFQVLGKKIFVFIHVSVKNILADHSYICHNYTYTTIKLCLVWLHLKKKKIQDNNGNVSASHFVRDDVSVNVKNVLISLVSFIHQNLTKWKFNIWIISCRHHGIQIGGKKNSLLIGKAYCMWIAQLFWIPIFNVTGELIKKFIENYD